MFVVVFIVTVIVVVVTVAVVVVFDDVDVVRVEPFFHSLSRTTCFYQAIHGIRTP